VSCFETSGKLMHYGPVSYYTLGRVYPRDRLRLESPRGKHPNVLSAIYSPLQRIRLKLFAAQLFQPFAVGNIDGPNSMMSQIGLAEQIGQTRQSGTVTGDVMCPGVTE
jgi:hypothetical protein